MRFWLALLLVGTGCDEVFDLTGSRLADAGPGTDGATDQSTADAPQARPCAGRMPTPAFCFDFDGPTQVGYIDGNEVPFAPIALNSVVERRAPSSTGANALWFTGVQAGAASAMVDATFLATTRLDARFAVRAGAVATAGMGPVDLFRLYLEPSSASECVAYVEIDPGSLGVAVEAKCAGGTSRVALGALGDHWSTVTLTFDIQSGEVTASVDGTAPALLTINGGQSPQIPSIRFGTRPSLGGLSIGFDDIEVLAR